MNLQDLKQKLVAVLGYGQEGEAVTDYLLKNEITPVLFDQKPWKEWSGEDQTLIKGLGVNFIFGSDCFKELAGFDVAFRSPGVNPKQLTISAGGGSAYGKNNLQLTSQTKWFFEHCPAKIIGVTGTKGKGTTSTLIYEMLKAENRNAYLTGNIGKVQPFEILDDLSPDDWVVYELSSFQLQDLQQSPHIGVVLMVTGEHLDYHKNIKEYRQAKTSIVKYQTKSDFAIINQDFPASMAIGACGKGRKVYFSRNKKIKDGCFIENDNVVWNYSAEGGLVSGGQFPISKIRLKGRHNLENVCASVLAALSSGCSPQSIKTVLNKFKGLEHRLEFVAEKKGIKFFNDSFSTTPETCIAAIESFSEPLVVILGGSSKNSDFRELGKILAKKLNVKALIIIGQETAKIKDAVSRAEGFKGQILEGSGSMPEVFKQVELVANSGDVVLLSPACASFDMFSSYLDRGNQFKQAVKSF